MRKLASALCTKDDRGIIKVHRAEVVIARILKGTLGHQEAQKLNRLNGG